MNLSSELYQVVSNSFQEKITEILITNPLQPNAEFILSLCRLITSKIDIYISQQKIYGNKIDLYKRKNNMNEQVEEELMVYGAQLIYTLRSFFTNEQIYFHFGTTDSEGKYQTSAFVEQSDILKSLTTTIKNKVVGVSQVVQNSLINANQNQQLVTTKRKNLWTRVEYLSEILYLPGKNVSKIDMRKNGAKKAHWAYQNQKKDMQIYIKYSGKQKIKYYDIDNQKKKSGLEFFNNGWLWEWYNNILYSSTDQEYEIVQQSLYQGSLKSIILQRDYTPGTKQGDFMTAIGQQVQSKYNNIKIISYNNIRHILYDLENALIFYVNESGSQKAIKNLTNILKEHFFPESVNIGEKIIQEKVDSLVQSISIISK